MRAASALIIVAAGFLASGCGGGDTAADQGGETTTGGGRTVTVELAAQNDSGEFGTAILTSQGAKTWVVLELENPVSDSPQPAHIHQGTCAELDPTPAYPLTNVVDAASDTTVDVPLEELEGGTFAINVHKSETEAETYVSCGNIGGEAAQEDDSGSGPGYGY